MVLFGLGGLGKKATMPSPDAALPGRSEKMPVPKQHYVNGNPLQSPFPEGMQTAMFGLGCFWGAERRFWQQEGVFYSEPQEYFTEQMADVLVLHNPTYGFFDRVPGVGNVGSIGIRNHLDDHNPRLVVSGHVHEDYGVALRNGTMFLNPSNFGGVDSPYGWQAGGAYAEVYMEEGHVNQVNIMRLVEDDHKKLMEVRRDGKHLYGEKNPATEEFRHIDLDMIVRDSSGALLEA